MRVASTLLLSLSVLIRLETATWAFDFSKIAPLNSAAASDSTAAHKRRDFRPSIATNGSGTWIAVWESVSTFPSDAFGSDYDIFFARSTDNGLSWTAQQALTADAGTDAFMDLMVDVAASGDVFVVVWSRLATGQMVSSRSTDGGVTWSPPVLVASQYGSNPRLATNGSKWIAVWEVSASGTIYASVSTTAGATWESPTNIQRPSPSASTKGPSVSTDGTSFIAVAEAFDANGPATGDEDWDIAVAYSSDGFSWTPFSLLNSYALDDSCIDQEPRLSNDPLSGSVVVGWRTSGCGDLPEGVGNAWNTLIRRRPYGADWQPEVLLEDGSYPVADAVHRDGFDITAVGGERWLPIWGADGDSDPSILVALPIPGISQWKPPALINEGQTGRNQYPRIAADRQGHVVAVWQSTDTLGDTIGFDEDIVLLRAAETPPASTSTSTTSTSTTSTASTTSTSSTTVTSTTTTTTSTSTTSPASTTSTTTSLTITSSTTSTSTSSTTSTAAATTTTSTSTSSSTSTTSSSTLTSSTTSTSTGSTTTSTTSTTTLTTNTTLPSLRVCGDGHLDAELGEQCDDGDPLAQNDCCDFNCRFRLPGYRCNDPTENSCDSYDTCDGIGICQSNRFASGIQCRPVGKDDACDPGASCDGENPYCPPVDPRSGCFGTIPSEAQGASATVGCTAPDTVANAATKCRAVGIEASPSDGRAGGGGRPVTLPAKAKIRAAVDGVRHKDFKLRLNRYGKLLLKKSSALMVEATVTIEHGAGPPVTSTRLLHFLKRRTR